MRTLIALALWGAFLAGTQGTAVGIARLSDAVSPAVVVTAQQPSGELDIDVDVNRGGGGVWYTNPVWLAIAGLAVVVVLILLVIALRGGGTTVIRD